MRFRNRQRGFSLLEMMIVITLMIIIAAFATPTLVRTIRNYQMESAARQVSNTILSARYEAMRRNRRVCTLFQRVGNEGRYGLDLNGADRDPCDDGSRALTGTEPYIATNVTIDWWNNDTPTLPPIFSGLPPGYDSAGEVTAPANYSVTFSPRGTVVVNAGGSWNMATTVQMITLRRVSGGADEDRLLITVSPVGRVKLYRWDFAGNRWNEL
jgi:prepilin-type N-terminal cleavage/methylation domain-containing protein